MHRAVLALTFLLVCSGALASDQSSDRPAPPATTAPTPPAKPSEDTRLELQKPEGETPKADESWWQKLLHDLPNCKSFSDGCRTCSSSHVCSNIGIACQPKEWACNDAKPDAKPDDKPDDKPDAKP